MARNKALDDTMFNCSQKWEMDQVVGHYESNASEVRDFVRSCCELGAIKNSTHKEVYALIKSGLGYDIPV